MNTLLRKGDGTVKSAVLGLLRQHKVDTAAIKRYEKKYSPDLEPQFERLMAQIREFDDFKGAVPQTIQATARKSEGHLPDGARPQSH